MLLEVKLESEVIGFSELENGDPPMGVASGRLIPTLASASIQPYCIEHRDHWILSGSPERQLSLLCNAKGPLYPTADAVAQIPARIPRHSLAARLFHWIMAVSMFVLLFTAFLPKVGIQFNWVTYHWVTGTVLTLSVLLHIVHATFYLDFWSI